MYQFKHTSPLLREKGSNIQKQSKGAVFVTEI